MNGFCSTNPQSAIVTVRALRERCESLAHTPFRGRLLPGTLPVRAVGWGPYLIIYDIEDARVTVLRVLHGSRDVKRLLGDS